MPRTKPDRASTPAARSTRAELVVWLAVLAVAVWVYQPALHGGLLWDDDEQFAAVEVVRSPAGLPRIWLSHDTPQYYPLSFTAFWLLWQAAGEGWPAYHGVNLLLHLGSATLLWRMLRAIDARFAWLGAAMFALHPTLVPAVAWMCQLRNCLSLHLALWATWNWLRFEQAARRKNYAAALACFAAALLAKTAVAPLPAVWFLARAWRRPRARRALQVAPFLVLAAAMGAVTVWYEAHTGATGAAHGESLLERAARAGRIAWFYPAQLVGIEPFCFVHPRWAIDAHDPLAFAPLACAVVAATLWFDRRTRSGLGVALPCYWLMLAPVLGFLNVFYMRYAPVADHWHYPAVPVAAAALVLGLRALQPNAHIGSRRFSQAAQVVGTVLLAAAAWTARGNAALFADQETLWQDTLAKSPRAWLALNNYGQLLARRGDHEQALALYQRALEVEPTSAMTRDNLGLLREQRGDLAGARADYERAMDCDASYEPAWVHRVALLGKLPDRAAALQAATELLKRFPHSALAHNNAGVISLAAEQVDEAAERFAQALELNPASRDARLNLGFVRLRQGNVPESLTLFEEARRRDSTDDQARYGLGCALAAAGRYFEARQELREALRLNPHLDAARADLERVESLVGQGSP